MPELYPLQRHDSGVLAGWRRGMLIYEPGCGKTATYINTCRLVAPEAEWGFVVPRNALKGEDSLETALSTWAPEKSNIFATHYEALERAEVRARLSKCRPIWFDEIHNAGNAYTDIFRNCYDVSLRAGHGTEVYGATGSPVFTGIEDLAAELVLTRCMDLSQYNNFIWYFTKENPDALHYRDAVRIPQLRAVLQAFTIRRTYAEMGISMPPLYPVKYPVYLGREGKEGQYLEAAADFSGWYQATMGRQLPPLARFTKLRQLLSAAKVPTVLQVAAAELAAGRNVLIFTEFRDSAETLHRKLPGSHLVIGGQTQGNRQRIFSAARGAGRGMCTVATSGTLDSALNLQTYDDVFLVELPWTPSALDQLFKRVWRNKKTTPVNLVFFYVPNDKCDQHVAAVNLRKTALLTNLGLAPTGNLLQFGY